MTPLASSLMAELATTVGMPPREFWAMRIRDFSRILDHLRRKNEQQMMDDLMRRTRAKIGRY